MVTEARKRANAKWDKENMVVLACKVKRETAEQFKAACAAQGTTSNAVLQQAVKAYLEQGQHSAGDEVSQTHTTANRGDGVSSEMRGAMDVLKAAAAAQIADASHEMRNTSTEADGETEARRTALLESIKGL